MQARQHGDFSGSGVEWHCENCGTSVRQRLSLPSPDDFIRPSPHVMRKLALWSTLVNLPLVIIATGIICIIGWMVFKSSLITAIAGVATVAVLVPLHYLGVKRRWHASMANLFATIQRLSETK